MVFLAEVVLIKVDFFNIFDFVGVAAGVTADVFII